MWGKVKWESGEKGSGSWEVGDGRRKNERGKLRSEEVGKGN